MVGSDIAGKGRENVAIRLSGPDFTIDVVVACAKFPKTNEPAQSCDKIGAIGETSNTIYGPEYND